VTSTVCQGCAAMCAGDPRPQVGDALEAGCARQVGPALDLCGQFTERLLDLCYRQDSAVAERAHRVSGSAFVEHGVPRIAHPDVDAAWPTCVRVRAVACIRRVEREIRV